jgi:ppGpp synthetase/RelA/SpoT-type nucleotidyltranferase
MVTAIEKEIRSWFPDNLIDCDAFDDWCNPIREDISPGAVDLIERLKNQLESIKSECLSSGDINRDFWELFGYEDNKVVKSVASIRSKLARDLMDEKETKLKKTESFLLRRILEFSDMGRIRIVADFPSDITCLQKNLFSNRQFLGYYRCPNGVKDFVFDPTKRDGLKGHRARQFSVRVPSDRGDFGFEVQLMTRLQHAWDRRNHPLYEWQREKPDWKENSAAVELAVDDFACSEALHLVDRQADRNWQQLKKLLRKVRKS